jgi:benzoyl-CoA reductase/2-hydroxyglutaryl-CoA dehydratase subunit BcrC/BadD/HgdB
VSRDKSFESSYIRQACRSRFEEELKYLRTMREEGARVAGYVCNSFPEPVAAGLGLIPVRVQCGASSISESEGEALLRADVCPFVKSLVGNVAGKKGLHSEVDLWAGLFTCDQMRRAMFYLADVLSLEVHPLQLPATRTRVSADYYAGQIKRFVSDAEQVHGLKFDADKALRWYGERKAVADILIRAARSSILSPLDLHDMFHLYFISRPRGLREFFEKLIGSSPYFESRMNVVLAGSPMAKEDTIVLEALQQRGVSVIPLNCTGLNALEHEEDGALSVPETANDTVEFMAREAFWRAPCARSRPNRTVYERMRKTIADTGASGVILKCLKFCDLWYTERKRIGDELDVPVLVLDSVYAGGERGRIEARIDAFLETLSEKECIDQ